MRNAIGIIICILVLGLAATVAWQRFGHAAHGAHPRLFDPRGYEAASAAADAEKKLLLVKFTAEWCGPCKEMDATTLVDEQVEAWVKANAIAIAVDIDSQPQLADEFGVEGIPTIVAMRGKQTLGSTVGFQSASELMNWFKSIEGR